MVTTVAAAAVVAKNARLSIVTSLVLPNSDSNVGMIVRMLATLARATLARTKFAEEPFLRAASPTA
jgi:hypothetical protein